MPIYAYKCASCGHAKDVLQKVSDTPLTECPVCGKSTFSKQLTAAGFQLKGSGWYATDFRGGSTAPASGSTAATGNDNTAPAPATASTGSSADSSASPAASGGCGAACACH